jgi:histidinol phosphatase-like PHP family hydrolase
VEQLRAETSLPILRGVEIFAGRPSNVVDPTTLARLDHVVLGLHRYPCAPDADRRAWLDSILDLLEVEFSRQPVDILAHATREPDKYGFPPDNLPLAWQDRLVEILLRFGVALEINGKSQHPHEGLLRRARAAGVQLSFGSDVHHEAQIHNAVEYCETVVRHLGLTQDDLFDARAPKHLRRSAESWARVG